MSYLRLPGVHGTSKPPDFLHVEIQKIQKYKKDGLVNIFSVQVEEGWWSGNLNGKSGLFPSNFVKELDATGEDIESNDTTADETGETEAANKQGLISVKAAA